MEKANNILLKLLGLLLLSAAVMKSHQLLTEPIADKDIWSNRYFLILTVEFELALGIWLISGLFKKAAWLATLACFSLFSVITLYKGLSGADSCGCFGSVKVSPWITLFAVDLPVVLALCLFRPNLSSLKKRCISSLRNHESACSVIHEFLRPLPSKFHFTVTASVTALILGITAPVLALNEPPKQTAKYVVLEPEAWIGKELPILDYIDIGDKLRKGNWLILFYHHDCPDCQKALDQFEQLATTTRGTQRHERNTKFALIEVPPYGSELENSKCILGQLPDTTEWFVTTPVIVFVRKGIVEQVSEEDVLDIHGTFAGLDEIKGEVTAYDCDLTVF